MSSNDRTERSELGEISAAELSRNGGDLKTDKEREFHCPICKARCTEALSKDEEYGHLTDCPRRPDHLPRGGKRLKHTNHGLATDGGDER